MLIPKSFHQPNIVYFVNSSGLVELRIRKSRIAKYLTSIYNDKLLEYVRRKTGDDTIIDLTRGDIYGNITYVIFRTQFQKIFDEVTFLIYAKEPTLERNTQCLFNVTYNQTPMKFRFLAY